METEISVAVTGQSAEITKRPPYLVEGSEKIYTVTFTFDEAWAEYTEKMAVFQAGDTEREAKILENSCAIPSCVLVPGSILKIGVYGKYNGKVLPTIWCASQTKTRPGASPVEVEPPPNWKDVLATKADNLLLTGNELQLTSDGIPIGNKVEIVVDGMPEVSETDNGKIPMVVDGKWETIDFPAGTQYDAQTITIDASAFVLDGSTYKAIHNIGKRLDGLTIQVSVVPMPQYITEAANSGVYCSEIDGTNLVFRCLNTAPTTALAFNILITKPHTLSYSTDSTTMTLNIVEGG